MTLKHVDISGDLGTVGERFLPGTWGSQRLGKGGGAVSSALCLAWAQEPPLGEKGMESSTHLPRGLQGIIKNTQVTRTRARIHSWKLQDHLHAVEGSPPHEPRGWELPRLQTIILKSGFPGHAFALSLRKGGGGNSLT